MKKATETVVLDCSPATYWKVFLDEAYLRALYRDGLQFKDFSIIELTPTARKVRVVPRMNLPGPIESLIGDSFAYEEHGTLDAAQSRWTWRMVQPKNTSGATKKEIVSTSGSIVITPEGDNRCRRSDEVSYEAKMFGLGGLIERSIEKEIRSAWAKEFAFLAKWLLEHPA